MAPSPLQFLTTWLLDRDAGGVFGATDASGRHVLSTDKQLPDQASAVLALVEHGTDDDLRLAVDGLLRMQDRHGHPGFAEFTDRYWRPYPAGRVRTIRFQLHGATAMLRAAHRLDDDDLRIRALDLLNRCLGTAPDGPFPARLSEDWRSVLNEAPTPQTAVSAVRALAAADAAGEPGVDAEGLPFIAKRLVEYADEFVAGRPVPELARCGAVARLALALAHAGHMLDGEEFLSAAESLLTTVLHRFHDPENGAFWDRLAPDGVVRVDWVVAPQSGGPPFPIKRAADAAQLLVAGQVLERSGIACRELVDNAMWALSALTDRRNGGVFFGMGYHWATITDPAVTSLRLWWKPARVPGLMVNGGLRHLALEQKSVHTHATVLRALGPEGAPPLDSSGEAPGRERISVTDGARRSRVTLDPGIDADVELPIDRESYLQSLLANRLRLSRAGEDGTPDDRAVPTDPPHWHVSPAFNTIADLRLLGADASLPDDLLTHIQWAQNADGGFGEQPGQVSDVASTYRAVIALRLAGAPVSEQAAAIDYLRDCQGANGGFGAVPGLTPDVWHTNLAVAALNALGAEPDDPDACAEFVLSARVEDGGYANRRGQQPNTFVVRRALSTLVLLDREIPEPALTVGWLQGLQRPGGGFAHRAGCSVSLLGTQHAVAALALLDAEPYALDACERWLAAQQNPDGEFGCHDSLPTTADDSFAGLQTIAILRGRPNRDWIVLIG